MDKLLRMRTDTSKQTEGIVSKPKYESLLTRAQVAEMLNCHPDTIKRLEKRGKIPRVQITGVGVRYRPSTIQAYIEGREIFVNPILN